MTKDVPSENHLKDHKTKWYQDPSTLISFLALAVSFFAFLYSHQDFKYQTTLSKIEALTDTLSKIEENSIERSSELQKPQNEQTQTILSTIHERQNLYLNYADAIVAQIPNDVTPAEYNVLAFTKMSASDYEGAKNYYLKSLSIKNSLMEDKLAAYQSLGEIYFIERDLSDANSSYQKAVDLMDSQRNDPNRKSTMDFIYKNWKHVAFENGYDIELKEPK